MLVCVGLESDAYSACYGDYIVVPDDPRFLTDHVYQDRLGVRQCDAIGQGGPFGLGVELGAGNG